MVAFGHDDTDHGAAGSQRPFCQHHSTHHVTSYKAHIDGTHSRGLRRINTHKLEQACICTCMDRKAPKQITCRRRHCRQHTQTHSVCAAPVAESKLVYMESYAHKKSKVSYEGDRTKCITKCCLLCRDRGNEFKAGSGDVTF